MEAEGEHMTLTVVRNLINQDIWRYVLNASTTLDHIQIQWCKADALENSRHLGLDLPIVHAAKTAALSTPGALGIAGSDLVFLKTLNLEIQNHLQYQLVLMDGFTFGKDYIMFKCQIEVCLDNDKSRCETRRLAAFPSWPFLQKISDGGRSLQENPDLRVVLDDSQCQGSVYPGTNCSNKSSGNPDRLRASNSANIPDIPDGTTTQLQADTAISTRVAGTVALVAFIRLL
jgi:hypothetical protein